MFLQPIFEAGNGDCEVEKCVTSALVVLVGVGSLETAEIPLRLRQYVPGRYQTVRDAHLMMPNLY